MIVVLAGGVGAARFLQGVIQLVPQEQLTVIVNTGDDRDFYGLRVSPDSDIVLYTLSGMVDEAHGWGVRGDTYNTMSQLTKYGNDDWFIGPICCVRVKPSAKQRRASAPNWAWVYASCP